MLWCVVTGEVGSECICLCSYQSADLRVLSFLVHVEVHSEVGVISASAVVEFGLTGMWIFAVWENIQETQNCHQDHVLCNHHSISLKALEVQTFC